jgi:hypothetical protein
MDQVQEDLHHRLDQLRVLAAETNDPLAERLARDLIVEFEDGLMAAEALNAPASPALAKGAAQWERTPLRKSRSVLPASPLIRPEENLPGTPGGRFALVPLEAALPSFDYACG